MTLTTDRHRVGRYDLVETHSRRGSDRERAASFFLFKVVGLRRGTFEKAGEAEGRYNVAFIAGLIFGIASYFVSPVMILVGLGGIIAAYLVLISPEFGVLMMIVLIPVAPTMGLVAGVLYTAFAIF